MANTSFTRTYTDFATAVVDKYSQKTFEDNISRASPFLAWLMSDNPKVRPEGRMYMEGDEGDEIIEPIMSELSTNSKWYAGAETLQTAQQNVGTAAFFRPVELGASVVITGIEKRRARGQPAQINLLQARTDQAMITMRRDLAEGVMSDGSGSNGKQITGIQSMVPDDPTTGTYGRINRATASNSWWRSQRSRSGTTLGDVGDFTANFKAYGRRMYNDCTEGTAPDVHVVTQELNEAYHDTLQPFERHTRKEDLDLGFGQAPLMFMNAPVLWDRYHKDAGASSQTWYMLNSRHIKLRYCAEANFSPLGFQRPADGDYIVNVIIWQGQLTTNASRMHGAATGITGI